MAQVQLLTNAGRTSGAIPVMGTQVMVGGEKLDAVASVQLNGEPDASWVLTLKIHVNPATLFEALPAALKA